MYEYYACTLFDSSTSHSFVLATFVCLSKLAMEPLLESVSVTLPVGEVVVCFKVASGCLLVLCGLVPEADLAVFKILELDIILGMDWLCPHYACINSLVRQSIFDHPRLR